MRLTHNRLLVWLLALVFPVPVCVSAENNILPGSEQAIEQAWVAAWQENSQAPSPFINRLVLSESAYLKQHASNPIDWYPYGDAAFAKAKQQNKLILISVGYASCHWCHVMEKESFTDLEIAKALNRDFVSIKVDREQLPDIDAYYTMVVEAVRGESGWPMTVVLTPDRKPVFAANYLPQNQFLTVLNRLNASWKTSPGVLEANADLLSGELQRRSQIRTGTFKKPDIAWEVTAQEALLADIDKTNGGFGQDNKFPDELKLQFLLNAYKTNKNRRLKQELIEQLDSFMNSGLNDLVFGGVFRYTTDAEKTRPHFEKMLYNQALTVIVFQQAASWLDKPAYKQYADSIIQFVNAYMRMGDGSYAAAINADYKGVEGGYYLWPARVIEALPAGIQTTEIREDRYFIYGPFLQNASSAWKHPLQQEKSTEPGRIENRITAWNALWVSALLASDDIDSASGLADVIWADSWDGQLLQRMPGQPGFLDDYGYFSTALWQLYLKTGDMAWKQKARLLDKALLARFFRKGVLSYGVDQEIQFAVDIYRDNELPSPAATTLALLANHQAELEFVEAAEVIEHTANLQVAGSPELYLTLVQQKLSYPASTKIFAKGHGMISLRPSNDPTLWRLLINLDPDWHVNANIVNDKALVPLSVISEHDGMTVSYPPGFQLAAEFSDAPLNIFSAETVIDINFPGERNKALIKVRLQACSDRICLLPEVLELESKQLLE